FQVLRYVNVQFVQHEDDATDPDQPEQKRRHTQEANTPPVALEDLRGPVAAVERPGLFRHGRLQEALAEVWFTHGSLTFRECGRGPAWRATAVTSQSRSGSRSRPRCPRTPCPPGTGAPGPPGAPG